MKKFSALEQSRGRSDPFMSPQPTMQPSKPTIEIIEQPRARGLRFRYKCEGRSAGTIPGENSTNENRTYPTIRINNYSGPSAIVVVSCVTKDEPMPRPHPHALVGKDCKEGVCTVKLKGTNQISFPSLGIQCATKKEVQDALKQREKIRVDPWGTGYFHNVNNIELGQVRLAFQAFLPDDNGKYTRIVSPVYSQLIFDKKSVSDLIICRLSSQSGSVRGGDEVFLLCEKVNKEDIQIRFYEENKYDGIIWEAYGSFGPQDVHRQVAIVFKTPEFRDQNIASPAQVYIQLRRPSDDELSDPKPFQYVPLDPDPDNVLKKRKRKTLDFDRFLQDVPFDPSAIPSDPTKDALKQKLIRNQAKRGKPSPTFSQNDMTTDGSFMLVQSPNMFNPPVSGESGGGLPGGMNWSQAPPINTPYSTAAPALGQNNATNAISSDAKEAKVLTLGQDGSLTLGDTKMTAMSLSNYLEGFEGTSLPSLPSIGEDFPANMQVVLGDGQGVAAEETVQSTDSSPPAQNQDSNPPPQPVAASLDRRVEELHNHLQNLE